MSFALSTSWNAFRYNEARPLIAEIKKAGFNKVELSFNLPVLMVDEIASFVQKGQISVCSVHNFCPIPGGVNREEALPDYYSMSSPSQEERKKAVAQTKVTVDTASRLNAKAVVLHAGRVEVPERTRELIDLYRRGLKGSEEYEDLKQEILRERKSFSGRFIDNTLLSLEEIAGYAQSKNILIGIENRFYSREIPSFEEIEIILAKFKGSNVYYWHDTGHAQVMEYLGLGSHKQYLDAYGDRLLGIHLHNVIGCEDHQAPSKGDLDFNFLKPYLKNETIKVIEAHYPATLGDLKRSKKLLEGIFDEKS